MGEAAGWSWAGYCPICLQHTRFSAQNGWFRDFLICATCNGGSIPRERALMLAIRELVPGFHAAKIHESSPASRGVSKLLARTAPGYVATQFFPDVAPGSQERGVRCENLECQTFPDELFDLVITQDVMEHVFSPANAYREILRTLKPGGLYIHTVPIYKQHVSTERRAMLDADGATAFLAEPEFHGNPSSGEGSLVTFHYGYDLPELIFSWAPFDVECRRFHDHRHGIVGEFTEVLICRKPAR